MFRIGCSSGCDSRVYEFVVRGHESILYESHRDEQRPLDHGIIENSPVRCLFRREGAHSGVREFKQMKTAIVGLPMVGKTSLFTILTGVNQSARVGSIETRVGMTKVPDARLDALAKIFEPPKITYATVEYLDFPAISKEALRDPSYLASLRVVDALAHVLRTFDSDT